ncbi:hypothetical protein [Phenylobacterium koreense]|uniref:Uncharacterized protein n=1 Tax=Phenylobacterium koreense TaxID=266125 RepID=A0ABV2EGL9_9CAUL
MAPATIIWRAAIVVPWTDVKGKKSPAEDAGRVFRIPPASAILRPMGERRRVIDAEFEVVGGPLRVGDEHPTQKGWYLTDKVDRHGNTLWYKPPSAFSRWVRRVALVLFCLAMALGILGMFLETPKDENPYRAERLRVLEEARRNPIN